MIKNIRETWPKAAESNIEAYRTAERRHGMHAMEKVKQKMFLATVTMPQPRRSLTSASSSAPANRPPSASARAGVWPTLILRVPIIYANFFTFYGSPMFLLEYLKNPRNIGAIAPSSRYLAEAMLSTLSWPSLKHIVEYGPGTGVFTEAILRNMGQGTTLILVEANERFYERLRSRYGALENVRIIHGSAEDILKYVADLGNPRIDCVVSGLPFTSLPGDTTQAILSRTAQVLGADGVFITFQYTLLKKGLFDRFFHDIRLRHTWRNIPPAYVLECRAG